ncbi:MFS transporter [Arthrobacter sp. AQ5-05]|uniref:MFS transporter n=1 Tax=Arthrobacter sp. AQ5-05 TaxID=2184581 RepID=UPI001E5B705B|nr:MFS transporter [Arthrobacter sp. AQ5-05]
MNLTPLTAITTRIDRPDPRRWIALGVISLATLMVVLDASIMNIALPQAQNALGITDANRHWALTAYALTFGGLLLLGGRIADTFGRKRVMIIGLIGFALASALGGAAWSAEVLFTSRALQGVFAAFLAPAGLALLAVTFTDGRERAKAFGVYASVQGAGGAIGLLLGGFLTEYFDWRWCLYVNVPIAAFTAIAALPATQESRVHARNRRFDALGAVLATAGSVGLVAGFTLAADSNGGWTAPSTMILLIGSVALLALFLWWQTKSAAPMLPLRIMGDRTRGIAFLIAFLIGAGMFGMFLFLTYYLQLNLGYTPFQAGLSILPFSVSLIIVAQIASRLLPRTGPRPLIISGMVLSTAGLLLLTTIDGSLGWGGGTLVPEVLMGVGLGLVFVPMNTAALNGIAAEDTGIASAILNTAQQLGGALGVALLNTIYTTAIHGSKMDPTDLIGGYQAAFIVASGLFVAALVGAIALPRNKAL